MKQILVFLLFATCFCWLMFSPMYRHVAVMRHAAIQQEVDYLLEIGASARHGYISDEMINQSKNRLIDRGFDEEHLIYHVETTTDNRGTDPIFPVPRGEGIILAILYPYETLFFIDRLIGVSGPDPEARMGAKGIKMSEYVP